MGAPSGRATKAGSVRVLLLALSSIAKGRPCRISSIRAFLLQATGSFLRPPRIPVEDHVESDLRNCKHSLREELLRSCRRSEIHARKALRSAGFQAADTAQRAPVHGKATHQRTAHGKRLHRRRCSPPSPTGRVDSEIPNPKA